MSKLAIFKTQDASQIEGGVAGQIQLETLKPLNYGKRRFQVDLKGNVNPDQLNQSDTLAGDIGFRGTASYVDQWEMSGGGSVGLAIGIQKVTSHSLSRKFAPPVTPAVHLLPVWSAVV